MRVLLLPAHSFLLMRHDNLKSFKHAWGENHGATLLWLTGQCWHHCPWSFQIVWQIQAEVSVFERFAVPWFCNSIGLSRHAQTHVAQKQSKQTEALAKAFIELVRHRVLKMLADAVVNMDKIPIPFSYNARRTLAQKGSSTIHILAPGEKDRVTFNATVTLSVSN